MPRRKSRVQLPPGTFISTVEPSSRGETGIRSGLRNRARNRAAGSNPAESISTRSLVEGFLCACSSMAELLPSKQVVVGSTPIGHFAKIEYDSVAQWEEHPSSKRRAAGSNPAGVIFDRDSVAQLESERRFPKPKAAGSSPAGITSDWNGGRCASVVELADTRL